MEEITKQSVSFEAQDRKTVTELANAKGLKFSTALRVIIREWKELKAQPSTSASPGNKDA